MTERASRDEVGVLIAQAWAKRGTCARRQVGCLLVDRDGWPLSSGYNGPPAGAPHCTDLPCPGAGARPGTGLELCEAIHAEANALMRCADPGLIDTCYVTSSPCLHCVKMLMNTSCNRIVFVERYAHDAEACLRWLNSKSIIQRAWVEFRPRHVLSPVGS